MDIEAEIDKEAAKIREEAHRLSVSIAEVPGATENIEQMTKVIMDARAIATDRVLRKGEYYNNKMAVTTSRKAMVWSKVAIVIAAIVGAAEFYRTFIV